jgi:D-tyrosyl-tRNA(Tyr) deacylase
LRAVVQRVERASVQVDGEMVGAIERGLLILVAAGKEDTAPGAAAKAAGLADKIAHLRIFADDAGRSNLSLLDTGGSALVISQFTLYADTRRGRRPSFTEAAEPGVAETLVEEFRRTLERLGIVTVSGRFGAHMSVSLVNDGPYTIVLDTED